MNGLRIAVIAVALFVAAFVAGYIVLSHYHYVPTRVVTTEIVKRYTETTTVPSYTTITKLVTKTMTTTKLVTTTSTATKYVYSTRTVYVTPTTSATVSAKRGTSTSRALHLAPAQLFASIPSLSIRSLADLDPIIKSIESLSYRYAAPETITVTPSATPRLIVPLATRELKAVASSVPAYSRTTVQVEGVDELDIAKTDGRAIYYMAGVDRNVIYIVNASSDRVASKILLDDYVSGLPVWGKGLYVWNKRLVVIAQGYSYEKIVSVSGKGVSEAILPRAPVTYVLVFNVSDITHPRLLMKYNITGTYVASRLYSGYVYIVVRKGLTVYWISGRPYISIVMVDGIPPPPTAIMVPPIVASGYYPRASYVVISCLDLRELKTRNYVFVLTDASRIYMVPGRLYIVSSSFVEPIYRIMAGPLKEVLRTLGVSESEMLKIINVLLAGDVWDAMKLASEELTFKGALDEFVKLLREKVEGVSVTSRTAIYEFAVNGLRLKYVGSTIVNGSVLQQFAVNQLGKYLVVATTVTGYKVKLLEYTLSVYGPWVVPWYFPSSSTTITIPVTVSGEKGVNKTQVTVTIRPPKLPRYKLRIVVPVLRFVTQGVDVYIIDSDSMKVVKVLKNVVRNERVYGARLVGHVLFLVTARTIDPLFAIDLSNPLKPRVVGYVKMPGYITFLQPVAKGVLLGVGMAPSSGWWWSLKVQLFNVTNLRNITIIATLTLGKCRSQSVWNYHAITFDFQLHRLYIPVAYEWRVVGAAAIKYSSTGLKLLKVLVDLGAERVVWVGNKVFVLAPHEIAVFDRVSLKPVTAIPLT